MNYWLLTCGPDRYPIDERLADPDPAVTWRVNRFADDIMAGDLAFVWRTGEDAGVCAVLHASSSPEVVDCAGPGDVDCVDIEFGNVYTFRGQFVNRGFFLTEDLLRQHPVLGGMSVFREPHIATAYSLSGREAGKLLELIAAGRR